METGVVQALDERMPLAFGPGSNNLGQLPRDALSPGLCNGNPHFITSVHSLLAGWGKSLMDRLSGTQPQLDLKPPNGP